MKRRVGLARELGLLALILVVATVVRIPLAKTPGFTADVNRYMQRSWKAAVHGVGSAYTDGYGIKAANDLPGLIYVFEAVGLFHHAFVDHDFPPPTSNARRNADHRLLLRIPGNLADLLTGLLIYASVRRRTGVKRGLILMSAYVFNPAILFSSALAGQTQGVYIVLVVAAFVALEWRLPTASWLAIALAAGTKPQAWPFIPVIAVLTLRQFGRRQLITGLAVAGAVAIVLLAPIYASGHGPDMISHMFLVSDENNDVTHNAHNLWWLVVQSGGIPDNQPFPLLANLGLSGITYRLVGLAAFALVWASTLIALWRRSDATRVYLWSAFLFFGFFMLVTNMHQWYLVGVLPLLALAMAEAPRWVWAYVLLSITSTANQALHYPAIIDPINDAAGPGVLIDELLRLPRLINAWVNVLAFAAWAFLLAWWARASRDDGIMVTSPKEP